MTATRVDVAVVGAGVAGLAAAWRLTRIRPDLDVVVLDAAARVGGKLAVAEVGGVQVDVGAEAMLARRPEGIALAEDAGLADSLVAPATTAANVVLRRGRSLVTVRLPRTMMGVPADLRDVGDVLTGPGMTRARLDSARSAVRLAPDEDVSVGDLVEQRLGHEVVDRLVEPMLGGVYAGHSHELSLRATVPALAARLDGSTGLVGAAAGLFPEPDPDAPPRAVFAGIRGGVGRLPVALGAHLRVETSATVRELRRTATGWSLTVGETRSSRHIEARAVVVATPAAAGSKLLRDVVPAAARELAAIEYASMAVITLAFAARDLPALAGSGFLVPPSLGLAVKGATYSFAKWAWVSEAGGDVCVLRCSIGRHREESVLQVDDAALVDLALVDLSAITGLGVRPIDAHVQRWGGGLPQYAVGHLDRVASIRRAVAEAGGLAVAGAAYDGVGIPACIASADRAVTQIIDHLDAAPAAAEGE